NRARGRVKVVGKAALPPAVRKASGFPARRASLLPLGSAGRLSLPAEPRGLVRAEALGKAKPFRTAGGRAALGCYLSGTEGEGSNSISRDRSQVVRRHGE